MAGRRYRHGRGPADPSQRDAPAAGSARGRGGTPAGQPDRDPAELAREICLRQLAVRPRTRAELATAMRKRGIDDEIVDSVLDRYDEVGIINDEAFARAWVTSRHHGKGLARRALAGELRRKGVDPDAVGEALDELDPQTEEETAKALVARRMRIERSAPPDAAFRRLVGMLARKGYPAGLAIRVVKDALAAEAETAEFADGLDPDALAEAAEPAGE
ncbi:regulatory protein RecX [Planosporangium mesophilum]|uniref:Regulatory protein RecX n=1 Tax=Planosporangium mesophilum TaxID=689768 RepID=A0A8J3T7J7_9ACTN|nr:regulatory protein RecX [Planosporangium mesophilum]GII20551.1 regulatory protein RecX [Planosporangium mesophilum]